MPENMVTSNGDESFDSSRFDNIFNAIQQLLAEYFLSVLQIDLWYDGSTLTKTSRMESSRTSVLQIDFRYAFPSNERWFIRFSINRESTSGRTIRKLPFTNRIGLGVLDNLLRANIFSARPTHLSPTPSKETRKSAVYQLACTYTQKP